jgi:prophage regulatory protein
VGCFREIKDQLMKNASMPSGQERSLWRQPFVREKSGLPKSTLYRLIAEGKFPAPIPLVGRSVAWDSVAVQRWIDQRVEAAGGTK